MLIAPGLWAVLRPLNKGVNLSVRWNEGLEEGMDPFDFNSHMVRDIAMRNVTETYIGSVSALNWTDRAKVLEFFAAQDFL
jgi:hypothetical protein